MQIKVIKYLGSLAITQYMDTQNHCTKRVLPMAYRGKLFLSKIDLQKITTVTALFVMMLFTKVPFESDIRS